MFVDVGNHSAGFSWSENAINSGSDVPVLAVALSFIGSAQRAMAWFALLGMLLYPSLVVISSWIGLEQAANLLGNMAPTYYVSTAALVASYYGASAWQNRGNGK